MMHGRKNIKLNLQRRVVHEREESVVKQHILFRKMYSDNETTRFCL